MITGITLLKDFLNSLLHKAPTPKAGKEKPPIITAIIFAIGIKTIAGRNIIACA